MIEFLSHSKKSKEDLPTYVNRVRNLGASIRVNSFQEYVEVITACDKIKAGKMYRGQYDREWGLKSYTYRDLEDKGCLPNLKTVKQYTIGLLEKARLINDPRISQDISDLNLLAEMQHYGGRTILLDFSYSPLVALFFACNNTSKEKTDKDGAVYAVLNEKRVIPEGSTATDDLFLIEEIKDEKVKIEKLFLDTEKTYIWQPPYQNRRILVQQSVFLANTTGKINKRNTLEIVISSRAKSEVFEQLSILGIKTECLFADFMGVMEWYCFDKKSASNINEELLIQANTYFENLDYENALDSWIEYLTNKNEDINQEDLASINKNIATAYFRQRQYSFALEWYDKTLQIRTSVLGTKHPDTVELFTEIANVYSAQYNFRNALEWYNKALKDQKPIYGKDHPSVATTYNNIATVYSRQGNYPKALEWCQKALEIREKVLGKEHPDTASTYGNIAGVYYSQGDYPKAFEWYQKALEIFEKVLGKEHPDTATTYDNIARVYSRQGDYPKALEWYQKALEIYEKVLGKEHPDTATTYDNIAGVYHCQGDYPKALEWYQKALEIYEIVFGKDHPSTFRINKAIEIIRKKL